MCAARFLCGLEFLRGPLQCREVTPAEQGSSSWSFSRGQSHHRSRSRRWMVSGVNRFRMGFAGTPAYDGVGLHVPSHHRPGGHDGAVTDPHAGEDDGLIADPDIAADDNVPRLSQVSVISETDVSHAS